MPLAEEVPNKAQTDLSGDILAPESILNFVPEAYKVYDANDKLGLNIYTLTSEIIDQIEADIHELSLVSVESQLSKEFKIDEIFSTARSYYTVRSSELLKGFFQFKGTKQDLLYLIANANYLAAFIEKTDDNTIDNCAIIYKIFLDLDSPDFHGYTSNLKQKAYDLFSSRLFLCAYLGGVQILVVGADLVDLIVDESYTSKVTLNLTDGVNDNFKANQDCNKADIGLKADRQDLWLKIRADMGWTADTHENIIADGDNRWSYMRDLPIEVTTQKLNADSYDLDEIPVEYFDLHTSYANQTQSEVVEANNLDLESTKIFRKFIAKADMTDSLQVLDIGILDTKYNVVFSATSDTEYLSYIYKENA